MVVIVRIGLSRFGRRWHYNANDSDYNAFSHTKVTFVQPC